MNCLPASYHPAGCGLGPWNRRVPAALLRWRQPFQELPEHGAKPIGVFRHHEMAGLVLHDLRAGDLGLMSLAIAGVATSSLTPTMISVGTWMRQCRQTLNCVGDSMLPDLCRSRSEYGRAVADRSSPACRPGNSHDHVFSTPRDSHAARRWWECPCPESSGRRSWKPKDQTPARSG